MQTATATVAGRRRVSFTLPEPAATTFIPRDVETPSRDDVARRSTWPPTRTERYPEGLRKARAPAPTRSESEPLPTFGEPEPMGMNGMGGGLGAEFAAAPEPDCEAVVQWRAATDARLAAKAAEEESAVAAL